MKRLIATFAICLSARATDVSTFCIGQGGAVLPSTNITASFRMQGVDSLHVWINGVDKGILAAPFQATYSSGATGTTNTLVVEYCDFAGRKGTNTFYTISMNTQLPRRPAR